jgi:CRP-like cAMP-binding protein
MWTERHGSGLTVSGETVRPRNLLLQSLPDHELGLLYPLLERVPLTPKRVLQHAGLPIEHLYFVEEGLVSVLAKVDERHAVEVWLIGRDGVVGSTVLLGEQHATLGHLVQVGGSALRIGIADFNRAVAELPNLRAGLDGYLHAGLMQSSQSAACGLRHPFLQRLARWLLMAHDRSDLDALPLTQDVLARALGVRRPTVSEAFKQLEQHGVFARERALIRILDRASLERIACRCYRAMRLVRDAPDNAKTKRRVMTLSLLWMLFEIELAAS